jgi:hypothetical protein
MQKKPRKLANKWKTTLNNKETRKLQIETITQEVAKYHTKIRRIGEM